MSSLRLALKQSLQETGVAAPADKKKKKKQHSSDDTPKKRGRPRKHPHPDHDDNSEPDGSDDDGSEKEFSYHSSEDEDHDSDGEGQNANGESEGGPDTKPAAKGNDHDTGNDGDHDEEERRRKKLERKQKRKELKHSAANVIQSQWKKKKEHADNSQEGNNEREKPSSGEAEPAALPSSKSGDDSEKPKKKKNRDKSETAKDQSSKPKTVTPPTAEVIEWARNMSEKKSRKHVASGLRVKVRFATKIKKEGKVIKKKKWYGGRVSAVGKEGSKVRIKYDDGTSEISKFPDKDVVVDDVDNGEHQVSADKFVPPRPKKEETQDLVDTPEPAKNILETEQEKAEDKKPPAKSLFEENIVEETETSRNVEMSSEPVSETAVNPEQNNSIQYSQKTDDPVEEQMKIDTPQATEMTPRKHARPSFMPESLGSPEEGELSPGLTVSKTSGVTPKQDEAEEEVDGSKNHTEVAAQVATAKAIPEPMSTDKPSQPTIESTTTGSIADVAVVDPHENDKQSLDETRADALGKSELEVDKPAAADNAEKLPREQESSENVQQVISSESQEGGKRKRSKSEDSTKGEGGHLSKRVHIEESHTEVTSAKESEKEESSPLDEIGQHPAPAKPQISDQIDDKQNGINVEDSVENALEEMPGERPAINTPMDVDAEDGSKKEEISSPRKEVTIQLLPDAFEKSEETEARVKTPIESEQDSLKEKVSSLDDLDVPKAEVHDNTVSVALDGTDEKSDPTEKVSSQSRTEQHGNPGEDGNTEVGKKKRKRKKDGNESDDSEDEREWVCCDKCKKWRILPSTVQASSLPDKWYCEMNVYDTKRNNCDAPEQTLKQVAKERKKAKKRARQQKLLEQRELLAEKSRPDKDQEPKIDSHATKSGEILTSPKKGKRASPTEDRRPDGSEKPEKKKKGKKAKALQSKEHVEPEVEAGPEPEPEPPVEPKKKKRGRPARERTPEEIRAQEQADADNVEWVQCEKCDKWRKLPPHISADELPDVWYCTMNYWYPSSASCDAPEDKADAHHQDVGVAGLSQGSVGKFSYRSLIFGNGRKLNRPMSERTRAAESLFARPIDEVTNPYPTVMYSKSSAFLPRTSNFNKATVVEDSGPTVFDVLSSTNLWAELRNAADPTTVTSMSYQKLPTYDSLADDTKRLIKEIVLQSLGSLSLTGDQVVYAATTCRQLEDSSLGELRAYCTADILMNALLDLVQDDLVEMSCNRDLTIPSSQWIPIYRKIPRRREVNEAMKSSRCMKISKPWKRTVASS